MGFVRIVHMPYMHGYVSLLSKENELHLISWNRSGTPDAGVPAGITKSFVFDEHIEDADALKSKLPRFARFRKFALGIIDSEKYDRIVVLHSTPGITILDRLSGEYRGRYILDFRDVSHESHGFYRKLISRLSRNAGLVFASSSAYMQYLENSGGVLLKHNLLPSELSGERRKRNSTGPIAVRYWGMIRHEQANLAMIDALGGDQRFELHYHGREEEVAERLKLRVKERGYGNIFFHGAYFTEERASFAAATDLIHNVYENDFATIGAMGNKYYDGIQYGIPQICTKGSIMGDEVEMKRLGLAVNYESPNLADEIHLYYEGINSLSFLDSCAKELESIELENNKADEATLAFFKS